MCVNIWTLFRIACQLQSHYCRARPTFLVGLQDLLQHFEGVGLPRRRARLLILLDHLVHLRVPVELLHAKVRARAAGDGGNTNIYWTVAVTGIIRHAVGDVFSGKCAFMKDS